MTIFKYYIEFVYDMKNADPSIFSKKQTDKAGNVLRTHSSDEEKNKALDILSNWRASHIHPMQVFRNRLERISQNIDKNSLTAQRLKRVPSIIKKLNRLTTRLTQIQDIAGCRAVMSNVELSRKLYLDSYLHGDLKHELISTNDYIANPKMDGYRSIHLVYKYKSDKEKKQKYNGLLIEVQIRSKLQHIWATAVETSSFFIGQALKLNEGEEDWILFFKLVSSAFAKMEKCPIVSNTPEDEKELYSAIKKQEQKLNLLVKMEAWTESIRSIEKIKDGLYYYLLKLDLNLKHLIITAYSRRNEEKAIRDYSDYEKDIYGKAGYDVVLVGADGAKDLKKAYPNYFLDTKEFIKHLRIIINKY